MNRPLLVLALFAAAAAGLAAQQSSQPNQSGDYQGVSNPPADEIITNDANEAPTAKPPAGHPMTQPAPAAAQPAPANMPPPAVAASATGAAPITGNDDGIVAVAPSDTRPSMADKPYVPDPDGDIVHPEPLGPGELREGTMIRVRLENDLSSAWTDEGQPFRSRVASDVMEGGTIVIPAGAEISGKVTQVSPGRMGGHGSMLLRPDTVTLPNGESYRLHAVVESAPGTHTRVGAEGTVAPDSRKKRDAYEYGGAVGGGAVAGAMIGGPVGALAGSLVGAGVVTAHLLVSHPQAHLDEGDVLMLTLTERVHLVPANAAGQ